MWGLFNPILFTFCGLDPRHVTRPYRCDGGANLPTPWGCADEMYQALSTVNTSLDCWECLNVKYGYNSLTRESFCSNLAFIVRGGWWKFPFGGQVGVKLLYGWGYSPSWGQLSGRWELQHCLEGRKGQYGPWKKRKWQPNQSLVPCAVFELQRTKALYFVKFL